MRAVVATVCARCELRDEFVSCNWAAGNTSALRCESRNARNVAQGPKESTNGARELAEGDDGRAVVVQERAQQRGTFGVGVRRAHMQLPECVQRVEMFGERGEHDRRVIGGRRHQQFGKAQLNGVRAGNPRLQFALGWIAAVPERVKHCLTAHLSTTNGVGKGGIARTPGAKQSEPNECARGGAVLRWKRCGERENCFEHGRIVGECVRRMLVHGGNGGRGNVFVGSANNAGGNGVSVE